LALDITYLDDNRSMVKFVALSVDEHWELMLMARSMGLPSILRLSDYYEDVSYTVGETREFLDQVEAMSFCLPSDSKIASVTKEIIALARDAMASGTGVKAVAD
jgi:hypothetical protein